MDVLNIYCDLKDGVRDTDFSDAVSRLLDTLRGEGRILAYRITRRKLGLGAAVIPEWHIAIDFENLSQLDRAFSLMATRAEPIESLHQAVNSRARNLLVGLYRVFPDPGRVRGQERF